MKKIFFNSIVIICLLFILVPVYAVDNPFPLVPESVASSNSNTFCDAVNLLLQAARVLLYVLPSGALLMLIYVAFLLVTSGGNSEQVDKAKKAGVSLAVGVALFAFAWTGVNAMIAILTGKDVTEITEETYLFSDSPYESRWWEYDCGDSAGVDSCEGVAIGTKCSSCSDNQFSGDTNCRCYVEHDEYSDYLNIESAGQCTYDGDNKCSCMSVCENLSQEYSATLSDYKCIGLDDSSISQRDCKIGEYCPYSSSGTMSARCCGPVSSDSN